MVVVGKGKLHSLVHHDALRHCVRGCGRHRIHVESLSDLQTVPSCVQRGPPGGAQALEPVLAHGLKGDLLTLRMVAFELCWRSACSLLDAHAWGFVLTQGAWSWGAGCEVAAVAAYAKPV
jgi:hypothetical protein